MIFHASHIFMLVKNVWDFRIFTISVHNFHFKYDRSLRKGFINSPCLQSSNKRCTLLQSSEDWLQCIQHTEHKTSFYGKGKKYLKQGRGRKKKMRSKQPMQAKRSLWLLEARMSGYNSSSLAWNNLWKLYKGNVTEMKPQITACEYRWAA